MLDGIGDAKPVTDLVAGWLRRPEGLVAHLLVAEAGGHAQNCFLLRKSAASRAAPAQATPAGLTNLVN